MAAPSTLDLTIYQGDHYTLTLNFVDEDDVPIDMSEDTYSAMVRRSRRSASQDATPEAEFDVDYSSAAAGTIVLSLDDEDTEVLPEKCFWDFQVEVGASPEISTLIQGEVLVPREVTWS